MDSRGFKHIGCSVHKKSKYLKGVSRLTICTCNKSNKRLKNRLFFAQSTPKKSKLFPECLNKDTISNKFDNYKPVTKSLHKSDMIYNWAAKHMEIINNQQLDFLSSENSKQLTSLSPPLPTRNLSSHFQSNSSLYTNSLTEEVLTPTSHSLSFFSPNLCSPDYEFKPFENSISINENKYDSYNKFLKVSNTFDDTLDTSDSCMSIYREKSIPNLIKNQIESSETKYMSCAAKDFWIEREKKYKNKNLNASNLLDFNVSIINSNIKNVSARGSLADIDVKYKESNCLLDYSFEDSSTSKIYNKKYDCIISSSKKNDINNETYNFDNEIVIQNITNQNISYEENEKHYVDKKKLKSVYRINLKHDKLKKDLHHTENDLTDMNFNNCINTYNTNLSSQSIVPKNNYIDNEFSNVFENKLNISNGSLDCDDGFESMVEISIPHRIQELENDLRKQQLKTKLFEQLLKKSKNENKSLLEQIQDQKKFYEDKLQQHESYIKSLEASNLSQCSFSLPNLNIDDIPDIKLVPLENDVLNDFHVEKLYDLNSKLWVGQPLDHKTDSDNEIFRCNTNELSNELIFNNDPMILASDNLDTSSKKNYLVGNISEVTNLVPSTCLNNPDISNATILLKEKEKKELTLSLVDNSWNWSIFSGIGKYIGWSDGNKAKEEEIFELRREVNEKKKHLSTLREAITQLSTRHMELLKTLIKTKTKIYSSKIIIV